MFKYFTILFLVIFVSTLSQEYIILNGKVKISARSSIIGIEDEFDALGNGMSGTINIDKKTFSLSYDMWNLDTGIELRNEHMHSNYLETELFPVATYSGILSSVSENQLVAEGDFTLHGIRKKLIVIVKISKNYLSTSWQLDLEDFNIEIPGKFMIAKLNKVLKINIELNISQ